MDWLSLFLFPVYLLTIAAILGLVQEQVLKHDVCSAFLREFHAFVSSRVFFSSERNGQ